VKQVHLKADEKRRALETTFLPDVSFVRAVRENTFDVAQTTSQGARLPCDRPVCASVGTRNVRFSGV
jgi:hypothetical protein